MSQLGQPSINPKVLNVLARQQNDLVNKPPEGVIFHMNADGDVLDIQADIVGPVGTAYEGGIFKCKIVIDSEFPQKPPKGYFLTKIFHPNVASPSGEICVNTLKKDWNPSKWSLSHIFEVVKCLLIVPFPESSLNEEAGREFMENYQDFFSHARLYTGVHARPNQTQLKSIEQHYQLHYKEAKKEELKNGDNQNQYEGTSQFQSSPGKQLGVLSQVTNSYVTPNMEAKGDYMNQMDGIPQGGFATNVNQQKAAPKKPNAAADSKKKWMRRI